MSNRGDEKYVELAFPILFKKIRIHRRRTDGRRYSNQKWPLQSSVELYGS